MFIEASLINSIFGQIRLNNIKLAHMPFTMAVITNAIVSIMVIKVVTEELGCCFIKIILIS